MTNKQAYAGLLERLVARRGLFAAAEKMARIMGCRFTLNELGKQKAEEARGQGELINPDGPEAAEAISSLLKRVGELEGVLIEARRLTCDACDTGFAEAECRAIFAHNGKITAALNSDAPLSIGEEQ